MAGTTTFSRLKGKTDALVFAALDCLVLVKPYDGTFPDSITDADGNLKALDGFKTIGEFQKSEGVGLTFNREVDGPEGYGSRGKRRYIVSSEGINVTVTAQEHRLNTLGIVYDANTKELIDTRKGNQDDGGFILKKNRAARLSEYTVVIIGLDGEPGQEIYPVWIVPKMTMTNAGDVTLSDSGALTFQLQFEGTDSKEYEALYGFGYVGPGMKGGRMVELMAGSEGAPAGAAKYGFSVAGSTGGTYTISVGSHKTSEIQASADRTAIQSALRAAGEDSATVDGTKSGGFTVSNVSAKPTVDATSLTGGDFPKSVDVTAS